MFSSASGGTTQWWWHGLSSLSAPNSHPTIKQNNNNNKALKDDQSAVANEHHRVSYNTMCFMKRSAEALDLSTQVWAHAAILWHRFFTHQRYDNFDVTMIAMSCLVTSAKMKETPRRLRDVINVYYVARHTKDSVTSTVLSQNQTYTDLVERLTNAEQSVLRALAFEVDVSLPYPFLLNYGHHLQVSSHVMQGAWALVTDMIFSHACVRVPPYVLAVSALGMAHQLNGASCDPLPAQWWHCYNTSEADLAFAQDLLSHVYEQQRHMEATSNSVKDPTVISSLDSS